MLSTLPQTHPGHEHTTDQAVRWCHCFPRPPRWSLPNHHPWKEDREILQRQRTGSGAVLSGGRKMKKQPQGAASGRSWSLWSIREGRKAPANAEVTLLQGPLNQGTGRSLGEGEPNRRERTGSAGSTRAGGPGPAGEQEAPSKGGGGRNSALKPASCWDMGAPERQAGSGLASSGRPRAPRGRGRRNQCFTKADTEAEPGGKTMRKPGVDWAIRTLQALPRSAVLNRGSVPQVHWGMPWDMGRKWQSSYLYLLFKFSSFFEYILYILNEHTSLIENIYITDWLVHHPHVCMLRS